jgi:hypothetical protein
MQNNECPSDLSRYALPMPDDTALLLERHFDTAFAAPDGIQKLRELILTLAMQGQLVPQDPNDQPARSLSDLRILLFNRRSQVTKIGYCSQSNGSKVPLISLNS